MDNLRATIDVLFNKVGAERILDSLFNNGAEDALYRALFASEQAQKTAQKGNGWFCRAFQDSEKHNSDDQTEAIFKILTDEWVSPPEHSGLPRGRSPFNVLLHFTKEVLLDMGFEPVCRYPQLLRWHELSKKVGQGVLTTAALAARDVATGYNRTFFGWEPIIGHDNPSINRLMEKGVAELHFHLKGSSLNFEVNWLCLMNHILSRRKSFDKLRERQMADVNHGERDSESESLYALCVKACAIRLLLFNELHGGGLLSRGDTMDMLRIKDLNELTPHMSRLQGGIEIARREHGQRYGGKQEVADYAIPRTLPEIYDTDKSYMVHSYLAGEREILYHAFHKIFNAGDGERDTAMLLYAYLTTKCRLRNEFLQLNQRMGFGNFAKYEERKELFIKEGSIYEALIPRLAVRPIEANPNVKHLEARITPKESALQLARSIVKLDKQTDPSEKTHYILHFIKKGDKSKWGCRHSELRGIVQRQAYAINNLLSGIHPARERIVGIDAANTEIGCRPEVFAQAFRFLRGYNPPQRHQYLLAQKPRQLGVTYHVGEDFMDLADGLRAVDEAILFLNLKDGDRLGHALALGIDAPRYYEHLHHTVTCPKHDMLDSVVWLDEKTRRCNVPVASALQAQLRGWFEELFREIYEGEDLPTIHEYYQSWLLRGDNPTANREGYWVLPWDRFGLNHIKTEIDIARKNDRAQRLFHLYHFNTDARKRGGKSSSFKIDRDYVQCIRALQEAMQHEVAKKHIGIETNLSSNRVIGGFDHYAVHPITKFFDVGLDAEQNCHQISVSINTDDQGIFHTSLENEFALMGLALEKNLHPDSHTSLFKPRAIYAWLDNVRELAFEQKFEHSKIREDSTYKD